MAVFCENCGKYIARRTAVCPHCKTPVEETLRGRKAQGSKRKRKGSRFKRFLLFLLFLAALLLLLYRIQTPHTEPSEAWLLDEQGLEGDLKGALELSYDQMPPEILADIRTDAVPEQYVGTYSGAFMTEYQGMDVLRGLMDKMGGEGEREELETILSMHAIPYAVTAEFDGETLRVFSEDCPMAEEDGQVYSRWVGHTENGLYEDKDDDTDEMFQMRQTEQVYFLKDGGLYVFSYQEMDVFGVSPVHTSMRIRLYPKTDEQEGKKGE